MDSKVKTDGMILALAGNQTDLPEAQRQVNHSIAKGFGEGLNIIYGETSAKTGEGISKLFKKLGKRIYKQMYKK